MNTMQNRGVVRKTDTLGRVCIPKDFRKSLGIGTTEDGKMTDVEVEVFCFDDGLFIRPYVKAGMQICKWCRTTHVSTKLHKIDDHFLCDTCYQKVKKSN